MLKITKMFIIFVTLSPHPYPPSALPNSPSRQSRGRCPGPRWSSWTTFPVGGPGRSEGPEVGMGACFLCLPLCRSLLPSGSLSGLLRALGRSGIQMLPVTEPGGAERGGAQQARAWSGAQKGAWISWSGPTGNTNNTLCTCGLTMVCNENRGVTCGEVVHGHVHAHKTDIYFYRQS